MSKGLFISFEGGDGSGKTTQFRLFAEYLRNRGFDVVTTREPGGTRISEKIRNLLLDPECTEMASTTEAFLFAASRAQHVEELIRPSVDAGKIVLCDRFVDSSIVYQGFGRGLGESVKAINDYAVAGLYPDATFLLDISPEEGRKRNGKTGKNDRLEKQSMEYHTMVFEGYRKLAAAEPDRFIVIDASAGIDEVAESIVKAFEQRYPDLKPQRK
ncbi:MAG: dTMP kinase [Clostridia bacterium]|nr:dTMP kinase [Clostridia bacterium]